MSSIIWSLSHPILKKQNEEFNQSLSFMYYISDYIHVCSVRTKWVIPKVNNNNDKKCVQIPLPKTPDAPTACRRKFSP